MNRYGLLILLGFFCSIIVAMEDSFEYSRASLQDVPALVELMNEEGHQEEGIVVPSKSFRAAYFQGAVENDELYVVKHGSKVVGYKKLFLMDNKSKKQDILEHEIRCLGQSSESLMKGTIQVCDEGVIFQASADNQAQGGRPVYMYTGGDFTKKKYRGRGLNKLLMQAALDAVRSKTKEAIETDNSDTLNIVYGITESNGAFNPGSICDRTLSIVKSFVPFAQSISNTNKNEVYHERFKAFKPSFAEDADEFKPLSDEFSVPGAGVVLTYLFKKTENK